MEASFQEKVLQLAADGRITAEEGERLLRAQAQVSAKHWAWALWNPFDRLPPRALLFLAGLTLLGSVLASLAGTRFDGTLDLHFQHAFRGWKPMAVELGLVPALSVLLVWGLALMTARGTRLRDLYVNFLVARLPMLLYAAPFLVWYRAGWPNSGQDLPNLIALAVLALPFLAWNLALLFLGIRNATGLKGPRLGLVAGGGLLGAEFATKLLLAFLH